MKLLIIGGSGFVSGTLAREAMAGGWQVTTVTHGQRPLPEGVTAVTADRRDRDAFAVALGRSRWDLVVDCIGYEPDDAEQDLAVLGERTRQLVFVSTDFVYDPLHRRFPQPEESAHYLTDGYGGKKRGAELLLDAVPPDQVAWTIVRPCHIYGPGSQLGCLPTHGRDPQLLERLQAGEPLRLVGGGHFLQQPIHVRDLAQVILSVAGNDEAAGGVFNVAGPDIVESREYYRILADHVGQRLRVEELPVDAYRAEHPEHASFLCHRIYDLGRLRAARLALPQVRLRDGLIEQAESLR